MPAPSTGLRSQAALFAFAAVVVAALMLWQGKIGFNLADEGFLWYGAQRVLQGEVPLRDFMSYDPGRYYWSAALMRLWGDDGIVSLRWAVAVIQAAGLFAALALICRDIRIRSVPFLLLCAAILTIWMFPRHKLFDVSLSIFLIAALTFLIQRPSAKRYFLTGLCIGLTAVFGRNHGVYGVVGFIGVALWLATREGKVADLWRAGVLGATGAAVGFLPMLLMMALIPGFAAALWESVYFLFYAKATNIPLPVPWPWRVEFGTAPLGATIEAFLIGICFIGISAFAILAPILVFLRRWRGEHVAPVVAASAFLALPYAHFAFSRADIAHLAQGIFPTLVGCLALLGAQPGRIKWPLGCALGVASFWAALAAHPGWQCRESSYCAEVTVLGDQLRVDPGTASNIQLILSLAEQYAANGETFLAAPLWPGAYPLLERKAPVWEVYPLFPRPAGFEQAEIRRIEAVKPAFVVIFDYALDGSDELRFRNTHPLIQSYIDEHFERLPDSPNPAYLVYRARKDM